ncbi:putative hydrolase [Microlunatus phosphovorus NM-1]|uniref:Putative hydrolase n=1 Tax=Microlunatus phosphovorus (strain ATCC 700054 / DSM 10555 / JCM 9379 / NBRC 101784 / NCIMB 13414 / VKM Ac-1990 / NM-1) TaxID=1032480 RepID=F5XS80_MICPN|nr:NUDIX hydrolase [Microlunatus phosphovorus]BAK34761.1 putative hydrolase [Microlunatus phosphovorus NM-1]
MSGVLGGHVLSRAELVDEAVSWPVTAEHVLGAGSFTALLRDSVTAPDGETLHREYLRHPGAVGIIALDAEGRVALIRQYRHAVRHRLIEPPAGLLDVDGERYVVAAQRELAEEAGLAGDTWQVLVDLFTTPGIVAESLRIYLARDLRPVEAPDGFVKTGEEAEMELSWASLTDLVDAVLAGDLHNPTMVSGVLAAWAAYLKGDDFASLRPADAPWPARTALRQT